MNFFLRFFLVIVFAVALPVKAQDILLPVDPKAPVITLDYQGGRLVRIDPSPTLSILADGSVIMPKSYSHSRSYQGQISIDDLHELISYIVIDNEFFSYDEKEVNKKLKEIRVRHSVHGADTVIGVNLRDTNKKIRVSDLGEEPRLAETDRLLQIRVQLDKLMAFVKLGGNEGVADLLTMANAELAAVKNKRGTALSVEAKEVELSIEDLEGGTKRLDNSIYIRFSKTEPVPASVTIDIDSLGKRLVTVTLDE